MTRDTVGTTGQGPLRVLYAEDDADIREVARLALEVLGGFVVRLCASGREAVDVAGDFGPDVILLDVMMPGLDGPATLDALRRDPRLSEVPVAFLTAKVQAEEIAGYRAAGAAAVITKPFDPLTLAERVRTVART